ncbi:MAG: sigma-70 family RNA polymerase sigma factor [Chloroflexi bacterium]|nr:sigma-70 family RNA polymerase sigma factor [Chloroflexota bacterium]
MQRPTPGFEQSTTLYQRYAPTIFAYLLRQVSSREDAEDLLLEVFVAVLEKETVLECDEQRIRAFIWTITHHKVADHYRRLKQRPNVSLKDFEELIYESEAQAPEQIVMRQEERSELLTALSVLPELQREVLHLRFGHELSCGEIAQVISKSEGAVRMLLHRSLKLLRSLYNKQQAGRNL